MNGKYVSLYTSPKDLTNWILFKCTQNNNISFNLTEDNPIDEIKYLYHELKISNPNQSAQ